MCAVRSSPEIGLTYTKGLNIDIAAGTTSLICKEKKKFQNELVNLQNFCSSGDSHVKIVSVTRVVRSIQLHSVGLVGMRAIYAR